MENNNPPTATARTEPMNLTATTGDCSSTGREDRTSLAVLGYGLWCGAAFVLWGFGSKECRWGRGKKKYKEDGGWGLWFELTVILSQEKGEGGRRNKRRIEGEEARCSLLFYSISNKYPNIDREGGVGIEPSGETGTEAVRPRRSEVLQFVIKAADSDPRNIPDCFCQRG